MKQAKVLNLAGRIALPILAVFLAIMEIGTIGVTVTAGWKSNQVASAILGNVIFGGAFVTLVTVAVLDQRRKRRSRGMRRVDA